MNIVLKRLAAAAAAALALALLAAPAGARIAESNSDGFTVSVTAQAAATPEEVWTALAAPAAWWSPEHSWSGNAANLSLEAAAGGCFCERWDGNSVEHARVIFAVRAQQLRLSGAFGPLQGEALTGVLTVTLTAQAQGTQIAVEYVVGGHARFTLQSVAPLVEQVVSEQVQRLAALFPAEG